MKRLFYLIILLTCWLAACSRLDHTPEPTPTLASMATVEQMGPILPEGVTVAVTITPASRLTSSATADPTASRTPTAPPPEVSFNQDGELLDDGWIRYIVPDSQIMVELPERFVVVQMNQSSLDEMVREVEDLFPEVGVEVDLRTLFSQNVRFFALDMQEVEQTEGQFAPNLTISVLPVGEVPLETLLLINRSEMKKQGAINISEPRDVSYLSDQTAPASIIEYDLPIGETTVHGKQLYFLAEQTLHIITASQLPNTTYSALLDEIMSRVQVAEGE